MFRFGQYLGEETLNREYKEFTFTFSSILYTNQEIENYLKNSRYKWDNSFNKMVEQSISQYLRNYIEKYSLAFFDKNTLVDVKDEVCNLYIGVKNDGKIVGIPYDGNLNIDKKDYLDILEKYKDYIDIEILPVSYKNIDFNNYNDKRVQVYFKDKKKQEKNTKIREKKYINWRKKFDHYSKRLVDLYNHPKSKYEFIKYLKKSAPSFIYNQALNGYELCQKKYEDIQNYRKSSDNIYYWICKWKDDILKKIQKSKPKLNNTLKICKTKLLLSKVSELLPFWLKNNNLNLFLIKINFYVSRYISNISNITNITNIKDISDKEKRYYRTVIIYEKDGKKVKEPCCIPY